LTYHFWSWTIPLSQVCLELCPGQCVYTSSSITHIILTQKLHRNILNSLIQSQYKQQTQKDTRSQNYHPSSCQPLAAQKARHSQNARTFKVVLVPVIY